jgi:hypothetical protein
MRREMEREGRVEQEKERDSKLRQKVGGKRDRER